MLLKNVKCTWCRLLGKPHSGFDKTDRSQDRWSVDVSLSKEQVKELVGLGLKTQIKNRDDDRGDFIQFIQKAFTRDGQPMRAPEVVDGQKKPWDQTKLIGNGSILNISYKIIETSFGPKKFLKPILKAVQVWKLEEFVPKSDFETNFDTSEDAKTEETWD